MARAGGPTVASGRRGYLRYQYGNHFWIPETVADFSGGMVRDTAREAIPEGAVYDASDFLLHQPGVAQKRGGTSYAGPALTGSSFVTTLVHAPFAAGAQLLAVGSNGHLYTVTAGTTTDNGPWTAEYGKLVVSPGGKYVLLPSTTQVKKWDGTTGSNFSNLGVMTAFATYKSRVVGSAVLNRIYFSPVPEVNDPWDTANSYIDADNQVTGFAALNNSLLIFSMEGTERIVGAIPPPNSDMDRAPLSPIGCTDQRSIVQVGQYVYFANTEGVYLTNGSTPVSLTEQGGISTYWRSLFSGYNAAGANPSAATWTIAAGAFRGFLFVSVLDASRNLQATLMCNLARRAWWRLTNIKAMCYATHIDGTELYYGDAATNRVVRMSGIFSPTSSTKNDADGTAVLPTIEFAPFARGPGVKSFGFGRLDFDMRATVPTAPTMGVQLKFGIEADTLLTPTESPLAATTTLARPRFSICDDAQALSIALSQTNPSAKTEIYALEVEHRPQSMVGDGVS